MSLASSGNGTVLPKDGSRIEQLERRNKIVEIVLYGGLAFIIGSTLFLWFMVNQRTTELDELIIIVDSVIPIQTRDLCPGDPVIYQYMLHSNTGGVIEVDASIWRTDILQTMIYSTPMRAILDGKTDIKVMEEWIIPIAPLISQVSEMSPGEYERRLAFRNLYQIEDPATVKISFSIRDNCPGTGQGSPSEAN